MKASIVTIGTEILIGQIIDTNSAYLGEKLGEVGVEIVSRFAVSDKREDMLNAFERAKNDSDLVLITGGLGPTKDDITKKVLAEFFERDLYFDERQYEVLKVFFKMINRPTTQAHKNQCLFPTNTEFLPNGMGTAPGMLFEFQDTIFISMPGVPYEMKHITENHVVPLLLSKQENYIYHYTIQTAGSGESVLAEMIEDIEDGLPSHIDIAYLPSLGKVRVRVSGTGVNKVAIEKEVHDIVEQIIDRIRKFVFGENLDTLESKVGEIMKEQGLSLACAESCTGGSISRLITSVSGSSAYFEGTVVSYSNRIKQEILGVKQESLEKYGAVSEQVVEEMISGALQVMNTDYAIAVSGIAGPTGGTDEKPVGTIYIGVGNTDQQHIRRLQLTKNREKNIEYTSYAALNLLRRMLTGDLEN